MQFNLLINVSSDAEIKRVDWSGKTTMRTKVVFLFVAIKITKWQPYANGIEVPSILPMQADSSPTPEVKPNPFHSHHGLQKRNSLPTRVNVGFGRFVSTLERGEMESEHFALSKYSSSHCHMLQTYWIVLLYPAFLMLNLAKWEEWEEEEEEEEEETKEDAVFHKTASRP
ncbi:unnamed protein product [Hydatigera taeniaeformis]|uniref:Uncharacterized protein n=1 Tax=Hydatigena taeniaeformis TaxID=6205 RepID=A0A0R3XD65_HYDTA|nr:unnamed protein product [Hydatigera taeniaeformis]